MTAAALILAATSILTSCRVSGLAFARDETVRIGAPATGAVVTLPVTVRWTGAAGQRFAVLVDRAAMAPGASLKGFCVDELCKHTDGMPDAAYLARLNVFLTTSTSFVVESVTDTGRGGVHQVTVVILDAAGRRRGETAPFVEFAVRPT